MKGAKNVKKKLLEKLFSLAALVRFELTLVESESTALPLGYGVMVPSVRIELTTRPYHGLVIPLN